MVVAACGGSEPSLRPLTEGDEAPEYEAVALSGAVVDVADVDGALLLNVWATWCVPCREEMPALQAVYEEFGPAGLEVVGVSIDGSGGEPDVRRFLEDHEITFPIVHDPGERVTRAFRTTGVPETFLIADGVVVKRWRGPVTREAVLAVVEPVLGEG